MSSQQLFLGIDFGTQSIKSSVISIPSSPPVVECGAGGDDNNYSEVKKQQFQILHSGFVHYDSELPHYHTKGGVLIGEQHDNDDNINDNNNSGQVVSSPILMFVEALELLLNKIPQELRRRIKCIGGSAQQHGSVYVSRVSSNNNNSNNNSNNHSNEEPEVELWKRREAGGVGVWNLRQDDFALKNCPIWMDSSTTEICQELEKELGGAEKLMRISGSTAHERFTASQIIKFAQQKTASASRAAVENCSSLGNQSLDEYCERICLISSFFSSYFVGSYQPIDLSDGSGMNLLDIHNLEWSKEILLAMSKLTNESVDSFEKVLGPKLIPSNTIIGNIHQKFCDRFDFSTDCKICSFSGDNQNSSSFLLRSNHDICISLGTSHTIFGLVHDDEHHQANHNLEGHLFINPNYHPPSQHSPSNNNNQNNNKSNNEEEKEEDKFLSLLCFKNGGMVRDLFCSRYCNDNWKEFEQLLNAPYPNPIPIPNFEDNGVTTIKSIEHLIGFYFQFPEITPHTPQHIHNGFYRFVKYSNNNNNNNNKPPPPPEKTMIEENSNENSSLDDDTDDTAADCYELLSDEQFQQVLNQFSSRTTAADSEYLKSLKIMDVKSLILSQFMSLRKHAHDKGLLSLNHSPRIVLTGGASNSLILLQELANVFHSSVHIIPNAADSTTLGAATRAFYSHSKLDYSRMKSFHEITLPILPPLEHVVSEQQQTAATNNLSYPNALIDLSLFSKLESKLLTFLGTTSQ